MGNNRFDLLADINLDEKERKEFDSRKEASIIIAKLIKRRMDLKMSQRELAMKTGIKQPMIARIENGDSVPRIDTLIRIAQ
ncbi:MAG: helix-turn-helix domain-containing protein, partial [Acholeplasmatales bacterium]|nr:helix-turn-helix domain-containing protein [Acholeplasmatales bacterium]